MAKSKEKETKVETEDKELSIEITPEQLEELRGNVMQTVMSIGLNERLYLENLSNRLFYLDSDVDESILHTITMQIYKINGSDYGIPVEERQPIIIIINSYGGSVLDGLALMDAIKNSKTPVIGVCTGYAMSMAFCIFSACHTRIAIPNAIFMYHDGYDGFQTSTTKFNDWSDFSKRLFKRVDKLIAERTKFTVEFLEQIAPHDNYWFTDEMVEKGLVDGIIGQDIDMEELFSFLSDEVEIHLCGCEQEDDNDTNNDKCNCKKKKNK